MNGTISIGSGPDPALVVNALLDEETAEVTSGYGGWDLISRPRRTSLTQWTGAEPFRMTLPILLDRFADGEGSVEAEIRNLELMASVPRGLQEPPRIFLAGPVPHTDLTWVLEDLTWGATLVNSAGDRTRQHVTLALLQYVKPDRITVKSSAVRKRERARGKPKPGNSPDRGSGDVLIYTCVTGDTLSKIAARELGSAGRWHEIAKLNGLRDPNNLHLGQKLRMPAR
jgi:nucleoid-associated protein YgaU